MVFFPMVRDVIHEFLEQAVHLDHHDIQQCTFGEAYVRLSHVRDRGWLVHQSPHPFGDVYLSFSKHNDGSNWRRVNFNRIFWILMIGVPFDFINTDDIAMGVSKFGKLISWENDEANKGRVIAKVRVTDLDEIPKSIRWSEGERLRKMVGHPLWKFCSRSSWVEDLLIRILFLLQEWTHTLYLWTTCISLDFMLRP